MPLIFMHIGLRQEHYAEMNIELGLEELQLSELREILEQESPFKGRGNEIHKVCAYLKDTNEFLSLGKLDSSSLKKRYITSVSIYTFADPLMRLELEEKFKKQFVWLVEKNYSIESPLNFLFVDSKKRRQEDEETGHGELVEIEEGALKETQKMRFSEGVEKRLQDGIRESQCKVMKDYNKINHYIFEGFWYACFPLCGLKQNNPRYEETARFLKDEKGTFLMRILYNFLD